VPQSTTNELVGREGRKEGREGTSRRHRWIYHTLERKTKIPSFIKFDPYGDCGYDTALLKYNMDISYLPTCIHDTCKLRYSVTPQKNKVQLGGRQLGSRRYSMLSNICGGLNLTPTLTGHLHLHPPPPYLSPSPPTHPPFTHGADKWLIKICDQILPVQLPAQYDTSQ